MDENQKAKMEAMKKQIQRKKQEQELLNNSLYQECLTALKDYVIVQDETDIRYLTSLVSSNAKPTMPRHLDRRNNRYCGIFIN